MARKRFIPIEIEVERFNRESWSKRWTTDLRCPRCGALLTGMPLSANPNSEYVYHCPDCNWWLYGSQMDWDYFDTQRSRTAADRQRVGGDQEAG